MIAGVCSVVIGTRTPVTGSRLGMAGVGATMVRTIRTGRLAPAWYGCWRRWFRDWPRYLPARDCWNCPARTSIIRACSTRPLGVPAGVLSRGVIVLRWGCVRRAACAAGAFAAGAEAFGGPLAAIALR